MKQNIQDGVAMAMVMAGVLLVMAVEGGAKAGGVSGAMMWGLLILGLILITLPVATAWLVGRAEDEITDEDDSDDDMDKEDAA